MVSVGDCRERDRDHGGRLRSALSAGRPAPDGSWITLAPSHQGRATEALGCLLDFVFGSLDKHRISAVTGVQNHARCLFKRMGFRQEGHFVEHWWYKGGWDSEFVFAMLKRE